MWVYLVNSDTSNGLHALNRFTRTQKYSLVHMNACIIICIIIQHHSLFSCIENLYYSCTDDNVSIIFRVWINQNRAECCYQLKITFMETLN